MADIPFTVTVSQVNRRLAGLVKADSSLHDVYVKGELSNFVNHYKTGHFYFTLKDDEASIKGVMFRSNAEKVKFEPESGMNVIIRGSINVFERDGNNQIYAMEMLPDGIGEFYLAFEQAKAKLEEGGYFSQKRPLPAFPKKICLITSETGAALQDMINIISRRCPVVKLILIPALVQGRGAPKSLVDAINKAQDIGADLIILGRGGGSIEDLSAFNDINLAMAVYNSKIPTISAVGHETDFTICDFVADLRAPTPSAAAELAIPDISGIIYTFDEILSALNRSILFKLDTQSERIRVLSAHINALNPANKLEASWEKLLDVENDINIKMNNLVYLKERELEKLAGVIEALSPMNVLSRGFSIVYSNKKVVYNSSAVKPDDEVQIILDKGSFAAKVIEVKAED